MKLSDTAIDNFKDVRLRHSGDNESKGGWPDHFCLAKHMQYLLIPARFVLVQQTY